MRHIIVWLDGIISKHKALKRWKRIVTVLAAIMTFATTYALILPAITVEKNSTEEVGGMYLEQEEGTGDMLIDNALEPDDADILAGSAHEDEDAELPWTDAPEVGTLKAVSDDYAVILTYDASSEIPEGADFMSLRFLRTPKNIRHISKKLKRPWDLRKRRLFPTLPRAFSI